MTNRQLPKLSFFKPRFWLLRLHNDLLIIHQNILPYADSVPAKLTNVEQFVIVLEDRRFLSHLGVDLQSSLREVFRLFTLQKHGGASTIDMQFVRTATKFKKKTLSRKLYECFLALTIQNRYSKTSIIRSYLNCAFFGSHLTGLDQASFAVFEKSADELSDDEAAFIAAMLVYPRPLNSNAAWRAKVKRRSAYGKRIYIRYKERLH